MAMVTKTKVSELLNEEEPPATTTSTTPQNYNYLSDVLKVTPSCLNRVEQLLKQRKDNVAGESQFLRVYVDAGGCSGFTYKFELDEEFDEEEDIVVVAAGDGDAPRVVVDETSLGFLNGSTLDFVQEMIKSSFAIVENPQSESACGCGSSFALKNFSSNPALD
jgi:iron-sulfur cluster assembly accessory protein